MKNKNLIAWALLILLAIIWGSSPILIKKALIKLDPFEIGALRLTLASFVLFPFLAKNLKEIKRKDYLILFISGIVGNVLPYFLYPIAQTKIDSATSGVLTSLTPFFALIVGVLFYKLKATKNNIIGLVIGFIGTSLLILFSNKSDGFSVDLFGLFVVAATLLYGINLNLVKYHLNHLKPITITSFSIVSILPITVYILFYLTPFLSHFNNFNNYSLEFGYVFILGVLGTSIATIVFYNLIKIKDTVFASMVTYLMPIVAIIFGVLDGEIINAIQLFGMALIMGGVFINSKKD
ncbi:MAG: EamA family transporter [Flammeovirgaceae bacterium]|nr:EamA family transporter [Flammeovirgaceae bacterium]|tara:strand:+ start:993 stop:1871 length:879 start_codon:yes stop_codon:yes gene_type:complete